MVPAKTTICVSCMFLCAVFVIVQLDGTHAFAPHCLGRRSSFDVIELHPFFPLLNLPSASFSGSRLAVADSSSDSDQPKNDIFEGKASEFDSVEDRGFLLNLRETVIGGSKKINKKGLTKMGRSMVLSYRFVSDTSCSVAAGVAWFIASKKSGLSPLAPGQWKGFFTIFVGFYAILNLIWPAFFALAAVLSNYFGNMIKTIQQRFSCSSLVATFWVALVVNFCGGLAILSLSIGTASVLAGVPVWAGR